VNKKKSQNVPSFPRLVQTNNSWLYTSQSARETAKVAGTLFSVKRSKLVAGIPEEPLASEIQTLLNSATSVIECATGGHGRCVNSACRCRCHKSRARARARRRVGI
jgi:hypothetical protein